MPARSPNARSYQKLTLTFILPLKAPADPPKSLMLEIFDPTYFVAFTLAEGDDAVKLAGAPKGCSLTISRPKDFGVAQKQQNLSEAFFQALSSASTFGAQFAGHVVVACS